MIDREPLEFLDPELRGLFASIGIQKGKPFAPDERMKKILEQAAKLGNATARALFWLNGISVRRQRKWDKMAGCLRDTWGRCWSG